jgi:hypothetical protein
MVGKPSREVESRTDLNGYMVNKSRSGAHRVSCFVCFRFDNMRQHYAFQS